MDFYISLYNKDMERRLNRELVKKSFPMFVFHIYIGLTIEMYYLTQNICLISEDIYI